MNSPKFNLNALLVIVTVFTAITLFVTVGVVNMRNPFPVNEYHPIKGTKYAVVYSTYKENGIYTGPKNSCTLVLEGSFGAEWGLVTAGDAIYTNEYRMTDLGLVICDLIKVDMDTFNKETLMTDAILRGTCASGEMVCVEGFLMPSNSPATNPLCSLYSMTRSGLDVKQQEAEVLWLDPDTGEILYRKTTPDALSDDFDAIFLQKTLEEARG